jgi:SAM-dependent methyltransferase
MSSLLRRLFYTLSYLGNPPWDTGISPPELLDFLTSHAAGRALDLGCGTGTNLITLAKHGWQVAGIDFSSQAVSAARKRLLQIGSNDPVFRGDVSHQLPVEGTFDLILDIGCYHDLSDVGRSGYRQNLIDYLAPGGSYLIYAHCVSPDRARATGVSQTDIDEFSRILEVKSIVRTTDRWDRQTTWMTFTRKA